MTGIGSGINPGARSGAASRGGLVIALGIVVLVLLAGYVGWWAWWLAHGQLAPSVLFYFTGIPSPTTGCARAMAHFLHGDILRSLHFNLFLLPVVGLFGATLVALGVKLVRGKPALLSGRWLVAWLIVLSLAWTTKFVIGPLYW